MCPIGGRLVNGSEDICGRGRMVCHCLLIETPDGLVLVDTGFGVDDVEGRRGPQNSLSMRQLGAAQDPLEPAFRQVQALGFSPDDVRHIVVTHLDPDHAGGLADFTRADVHLLATEHDAAMQVRTFRERLRYREVNWAHRPRWVLHEPGQGERWFGFDAVRDLPGVPPEVLLIPLPGHTRGHTGVAVQTERGWLLHAGDAYFFYGQLNPGDPWCTPGLAAFQRLVAVDDAARLENLQRLRDLVTDHPGEVDVFSAHDPTEFERLAR